MGIKGLTSFMDRYDFLFSRHQLYDTKVIIDGNNLAHCLYHDGIDSQYGGDYDKYAEKIHCYFEKFKQCCIQPYVLFDGAYTKDNNKLETIIRRACSNIATGTQICAKGSGSLTPLLAIDVCRSVLTEIDIPHITCDFEADLEIVALANHWKCPILSNDSDFYVYDCSGGVVLLDSIDSYVNETKRDLDNEAENSCHGSSRYLICKMYYLHRLTDHFKLDVSCVPFVVLMSGNDVHQTEDYRRYLCGRERCVSVAGLLRWLSKFKRGQDVMNSLLSSSSMSRITAREIKALMKPYIQVADSNLHHYFERLACHTSLTTIHGDPLPSSLVQPALNGKLPRYVLNVIHLQEIYMRCQVEMSNHNSSFQCSLSLRQILYGISFGSTDHSTDIAIEEHDRVGSQLQSSSVHIENYLPSGTAIITLSQIHTMPAKQRCAVLLDALQYDVADSALTGSQDDVERLLLAVMRYWMQHSELKQYTSSVAAALAVSIVKLLHVKNRDVAKQFLPCWEHSYSDEEMTAVDDQIGEFVRSNHGGFNRCVIHTCAEFQSCMQDLYALNCVLGSPVTLPQMHHIYNGTLVHDLACRFFIEDSRMFSVVSCFGQKSVGQKLYLSLLERLQVVCNSDEEATATTTKQEVAPEICEKRSVSVKSQRLSNKNGTKVKLHVKQEDMTSTLTDESGDWKTVRTKRKKKSGLRR